MIKAWHGLPPRHYRQPLGQMPLWLTGHSCCRLCTGLADRLSQGPPAGCGSTEARAGNASRADDPPFPVALADTHARRRLCERLQGARSASGKAARGRSGKLTPCWRPQLPPARCREMNGAAAAQTPRGDQGGLPRRGLVEARRGVRISSRVTTLCRVSLLRARAETWLIFYMPLSFFRSFIYLRSIFVQQC